MKLKKEKSFQSDVIVVGGGISGIACCLELLDRNKKVLLLERDVPEKFGGLAKESFGGMFFVNSPVQKRAGIKDSIDLALDDWFSYADFGKDDIIPKKWAEKYVHCCTEEVFDWLRNLGISFFPVVHWVERGLLQPGNSVPRFHMVWGTGYVLANTLIGHLKSHPKVENLQIAFRQKVESILFENDQIGGVSGVNEATKEPFRAEAEVVVVAAGGINGSIERVKKNWYKPWGTPPKVILNGSHRYADGTLHDATAAIGGNITHLDKQWNYAAGIHHPKPDKPAHGLSLIPTKSALWLNFRGERFGPMPLVSGFDTRFIVEQICRQEQKYSWQVMNLKIAAKEFSISGSEYNPAIRDQKWIAFLKSILLGNKKLVNLLIEECADIVVGWSIEELAEKMNALTGGQEVEVSLLKKSIDNYDAQIQRGKKYFNDEQLRRIAHLRQYRGDRVRTCKFQPIFDKSAMPLIAIREFILSRKSLGGIQTDLKCRVLNKIGQPIEGLYAVGEAAGFGGGGMHGLRALEGTFLGGCVLTGRAAAKAIDS